MVFPIEYDQNLGNIVALRHYADARRREAEDARLGIELELNLRGVDREMVLLEAENMDALQQTHRRYFLGARQILEDWRKDQKSMQDTLRSVGD